MGTPQSTVDKEEMEEDEIFSNSNLSMEVRILLD